MCLAGPGELEPSEVLANTSPEAIGARVLELSQGGTDGVVMASVNNPVADKIERVLESKRIECTRFGRDVPVPLVNSLADDSTLGVDRLLVALGAFHRARQACVVIDAGTAITVDFIDGEGTFHGGAIAPGLHMMLRSMHEQTAALPEVEIDSAMVPSATVEEISDESEGGAGAGVTPFGKSTKHAMIVGVVSAARGLCHHLIDRYAEFYRGYPRVVATGGDAPMLFENDPLVEHVVPDLVLIGMQAALERLREIDGHGEDDDGSAGEG